MDAARLLTFSNSGPQKICETGANDPSRVTFKRLQLCFATLCCLSGFVIAGGEETQSLTVIAVFFAAFGFIVVDWLELFALPALLAYLAMGAVAVYCVGSFWDLEVPGNSQMVSVAKLLVMVQSILMLQRKTLRIFEQLAVFCLLQLVVAAVFNQAMSYGLLLVPICLIGSVALCLMASLSSGESMSGQAIRPLIHRPPPVLANKVLVSGRDAFESSCRETDWLPRVVLLVIVPAVALIGIIFFYALPRISDSARPDGDGQALVGFSDELSLDQIGKMQQNGQIALRVRLRHHADEKAAYLVQGGIYLRGRVLDHYNFGFREKGLTTTMWMSSAGGNISSNLSLPRPYVPDQVHEETFYDAVEVDVSCESVRTAALFSIAPYYALAEDKRIVHNISNSTLSRKLKGDRIYPRFRYAFLTHGFHERIQNRYLAHQLSQSNPMVPVYLKYDPNVSESADDSNPRSVHHANPAESAEQSAESMLDFAAVVPRSLLAFDRRQMPTAKSLADRIVDGIPPAARNPMKMAERFESYLSTSKQFSYSLSLDHPKLPRTDPIEQFLAVDRAGHCQFFASAMVMMLRSQGIPARIVVGYRTDEYSDLSQYYTVRQLHAHAWVEALMHRDHIKDKNALHGQPTADQYWVRFDPTPSYSLSASVQGNGVSQVLDLAQNIWDDYVVDMDNQRQTNSAGSQKGTLFASYGQFFSWIEMRIASIRAGQLGGGSLAGRPAFSWPAAITTVALGFGLFILSRIPRRRTVRKSLDGPSETQYHRPRFDFYQETLVQLARLGIERGASQTPEELALMVHDSAEHPERLKLRQSLETLTSIFYRVRYGIEDDSADEASHPPQGTMSLSEPQKSRAETALQALRQRVDEIVAHQQAHLPNQASQPIHR